MIKFTCLKSEVPILPKHKIFKPLPGLKIEHRYLIDPNENKMCNIVENKRSTIIP